MVELVDTRDLKSLGHWLCRFKPGSGYQKSSILSAQPFPEGRLPCSLSPDDRWGRPHLPPRKRTPRRMPALPAPALRKGLCRRTPARMPLRRPLPPACRILRHDTVTTLPAISGCSLSAKVQESLLWSGHPLSATTPHDDVLSGVHEDRADSSLSNAEKRRARERTPRLHGILLPQRCRTAQPAGGLRILAAGRPRDLTVVRMLK